MADRRFSRRGIRALAVAAALALPALAATPLAGQMHKEPSMKKQAAKPLPGNREELQRQLSAIPGLSPGFVRGLTDLSRPALVLERRRAKDEAIAIGASKFGGAPDLDPDFAWPTRPAYPDLAERLGAYRQRIGPVLAKAGLAPDWLAPDEGKAYVEDQARIRREARDSTLALFGDNQDGHLRDLLAKADQKTSEDALAETAADRLRATWAGEPRPLDFLLQLDLASLATQPGFDPDLPREGRLLLFYDRAEQPAGYLPGSRVGFTLIWDRRPVDRLVRRPSPPALAPAADRPADLPTPVAPATVTVRSVVTPLSPFEPAWDRLPEAPTPDPTYGEGPYWAYQHYLSGFGTAEDAGHHQLAGWPQPVQSGLTRTASLAASGHPAGTSDDYRSDAAKQALATAGDWTLLLQIGADPAIGLEGTPLFVLIRRADLLARRFDAVWVIPESS